MGTFTDTVPIVETIPLRAVVPSTQVGKYEINLGPIPETRMLPPGDNPIASTLSLWRLYNRSVVSWAFSEGHGQGDTIVIRIGSNNDFGLTTVDMFLWNSFGVNSTGGVATMIGLELPAGQFASFEFYSGSTTIPPVTVRGSITMRAR